MEELWRNALPIHTCVEKNSVKLAKPSLPVLVQDFRILALLATVVAFAACGGTGSGSGGGGGTTTIPATPTGLAATAGNAQVSLSWNASAGATSYAVKRSTTTGGPYSQISAPSDASFTDSSVTNGTKYFYVVSAANSAGSSGNSSEVSATPTFPVPTAPANLAATAGNAQVALTWSASALATGYHVKRSTSSGTEIQIATPSTNSYTDTSATNGTKYFYVVSGVDSTGESANSNEVSATPAAPAQAPPTPTNLTATAGNAQVALTWSASTGATSYQVKRSTTSGSGFSTVGSPTATNYTDTSVTNGTTYYYVVSAVNSAGESANSSQVSATPSAPAANVTITVTPANYSSNLAVHLRD